jgi:hypothetical protein
MLFHKFNGRVLGLVFCGFLLLQGSQLEAGGKSGNSEVSSKYKTAGVDNFRLADYQDELLQCTALATIQMWVGDDLGNDAGALVRQSISENYWLETGNAYLSLAKQANGNHDLSQEVRVQMKSLTAEWHRLTENEVSGEDWTAWNKLIDRCESWRSNRSAHSFYSQGRNSATGQNAAPVGAG